MRACGGEGVDAGLKGTFLKGLEKRKKKDDRVIEMTNSWMKICHVFKLRPTK